MNRENIKITFRDVKDENDSRIVYSNSTYRENGWTVKSMIFNEGMYKGLLDCVVTYQKETEEKGEDVMSEYKPFLEIIKDMKEGDIADSKEKNLAAISLVDGKYVYWADSIGVKSTIQLSESIVESEYKIRPNYVSVGVAMNALFDGGTIRGWNGDGGYYEFSYEDSIYSLHDEYPTLQVSDLAKLKWTVEH